MTSVSNSTKPTINNCVSVCILMKTLGLSGVAAFLFTYAKVGATPD